MTRIDPATGTIVPEPTYKPLDVTDWDQDAIDLVSQLDQERYDRWENSTVELTALVVPADRSEPVRGVMIADDADAGDIAKLIGCDYIEVLYRTPVPGAWLIVDEMGLHGTAHTNMRISGVLYPARIVGDVLIVGSRDTDDGPDIAPLTDDQLDLLARRAHIFAAQAVAS